MRRTRIRIALLALSLVTAAVAAPSIIGLAAAGDTHSLTAAAASATARYHDLDKAKTAGYGLFTDMNGVACIDNQPVGGMGVHYVNGPLVGDAVLDATKPEALVYAPNAAGQLKLAALEYIVFAATWTTAGHTAPPSLFGQQFNFTPSPNRYGIPAFYSLHAWIWDPNTDGL